MTKLRKQVLHLHGGHINERSSQDTHSLQCFASVGWFSSHKCAHVKVSFPNVQGILQTWFALIPMSHYHANFPLTHLIWHIIQLLLCCDSSWVYMNALTMFKQLYFGFHNLLCSREEM